MNKISEFEKLLKPETHFHLIGIGGVSMSPLAKILHDNGYKVTGSDISDSNPVKMLRTLGVDIFIGHKPENVGTAHCIIRTAAAHDDNPEIVFARANGIPVFERAEAWGCIMRSFKNALCISGTHGKTTTTSMCTHILMAANADPTVMIGGTLPLLNSGYRVGRGDTIVMEACEYYNSFLSFSPTVAIILDIEADHLDFFKDLDDIKNSFRKFAELVPEDTGCVIANFDDKDTMDVASSLPRRVITFGLSKDADVYAASIERSNGVPSFDLYYKGDLFSRITLNVPGNHNILNALAAAAGGIELGIPAEAIREGLLSFGGAARRFEYKGILNGAKVYDDYAHHPGEIHALLDAASSLEHNRIIVAFQPHTYTRTKALFNDFVNELKGADKVFLAEIYAAREQNTVGVSSRDLADNIPGSVYCATFDELESALKNEVATGDIVLTVGAGDIYKVGENIVEK